MDEKPAAPRPEYGVTPTAVLASMAASLYAISSGLIIEPPAILTRTASTIGQWLARRTGAVPEPAR